MSTAPQTTTITDHEAGQVDHANTTGLTPVVFVHGLFLLPASWDRWAGLFEEAGYAALTPGWPDDPETAEQAREHPEMLAGKSIGQVADHVAGRHRPLLRRPARADPGRARPGGGDRGGRPGAVPRRAAAAVLRAPGRLGRA
jgi:hypothetical protein